MISDSDSKRLLLMIRADYTPTSGAGHIMRCLALAQAWKHKGGACVFVISSECHKSCASVIQGFGFAVEVISAAIGSPEDEDQTVTLLCRKGAVFAALDGYSFKSSFQKKLKENNLLSLVLDDNQGCDYYYGDLILNPNIHACESMYKERESYTQLLLQPGFFLIREEFRSERILREKAAYPVLKILISMGGSDTQNITLKVLKSLEDPLFEDAAIRVIVGSSNPHLERLKLEADKMKSLSVELLVNPPKVPEVMRWADVSISAGGVMSYELAFLGVPQINLAIADNQIESAKALAAAGASIYLGIAQNLSEITLRESFKAAVQSPEELSRMSKKAQLLVDGEGAGRVAESMLSLLNKEAVNEI